MDRRLSHYCLGSETSAHQRNLAEGGRAKRRCFVWTAAPEGGGGGRRRRQSPPNRDSALHRSLVSCFHMSSGHTQVGGASATVRCRGASPTVPPPAAVQHTCSHLRSSVPDTSVSDWQELGG